MAFEIVMKIGTQPYGLMHIKHARKGKPPAVGSMVYVKCAGRNWDKWMWVRIERYLPDMSYCFASFV